MGSSSIHLPIFVVGFMGSGKTTLGKKLSKLANLPFIDLDQQIVDTSGMSISDYFKQHGEEQFRLLEEETLKSTPTHSGAIVSTGGGTPCFHDNMTWMNEHGLTLYLNLAPKVIFDRLLASERSSRPLLASMDDDELLSSIEDKLENRSPFYEKAQIQINPLRETPQSILDILIKEIQSK